MAGKYNPTVVGTDAFFREICIGDEIQDLDGRHYTVDKYGRCKPLDGGNVVPLSSVKEAALVSRYEGPPIDVTERKPEKKAVIMVPDPRPKKLPLVEHPAPAKDPEPEKTRKTPGKKNKSGIVQITAITRSLGIRRTVGLTDFLHQHGIETTFVPKRNKVCIKIEDRDRVTELARQWAEKEPQPEPQAPKPAALPKEKKALPEEVIPIQIPDETVKTLCNIETGDTRDWNLASTPDRELAAELRRRGYVVTAIKHVEL